MILDGRLDHNHTEPEPRTMERQKIRQACKGNAPQFEIFEHFILSVLGSPD
jgi:hypothetical protein